MVNLGKNYKYTVHSLVARTFIGPQQGNIIDHKDGNKTNNNLCNLQYCSYRFNALKMKLDNLSRGIDKRGESWRVRIDGKNHGSFQSLEEAILTRDAVLDSLIAREAL